MRDVVRPFGALRRASPIAFVRDSRDAPIHAAMNADAMLEKGGVVG